MRKRKDSGQLFLDNIFATSPLPALKKAIKEHGKIDLGVYRSPLGN